jgi:hypothetical protein
MKNLERQRPALGTLELTGYTKNEPKMLFFQK